MGTDAEERKTGEIQRLEDRLAGLHGEYYDRIARYVYVRIGDRSEAQDIAGEVFLRALKSLKTYRERGVPMQAWLFSIAHNMVVDHLRKASRRRTVPIDDVEIAADSNPAADVERHFEMERVARAMETLSNDQREVVRLRFYGGLTSAEAGDVLGKSAGAVREMQRAALEKLRGLLRAPVTCPQGDDSGR
jgi:RNA polymerase sigma-70 factor (ECF subfamily)